jgi:hypothetical protein
MWAEPRPEPEPEQPDWPAMMSSVPRPAQATITGTGRGRLAAAVALAYLAVVVSPVAGATWTGELFLGTAYNAASRLTIVQDGHPELTWDAEWSTRPLEQPLYWTVRAGREGDRHGWYLDLMHHKLYLENGPAEVQAFTVTHGLNLLTLQHAWLRERWRWFVLAGVAIAHAENTVRERRLPEDGGLFGAGYRVSGPVVGIGAGASLPLTSRLAVAGEIRLTRAWLELDVVDGHAETSNTALHLLVGPRFRF